MAKINIKNIHGDIIFSFEAEDNTMRKTVEEAVRKGVSLKDANLREADLAFEKLCYANLEGANLEGVNLINAELKGAYLTGAVLREAYLSGADLEGANLEGVDVYGADMFNVKNVPDLPITCPSEGEFIAWKKISYYEEDYEGDFLVKLLIPEDAKRSSATTEKCRCGKAKVLEITNIETDESVKKITNTNHCTCVYRVGEMVYPDSFDENRWNECSHGIHFFMEKEKAISYDI